jgi:hypothetical protein
MEFQARATLIEALKALHSNPENPEAVIHDFDARAEERELQIVKLQAEANALRGIADNMRALVGNTASAPLFSAEGVEKSPPAAGAAPSEARDLRPEGMEAVRRIMKQGGVWTAGGLLAEMKKRGWESKGSKNPIRPTEAAINRLWKVKKEIQRVGRGQYRYVGTTQNSGGRTPELGVLNGGPSP